VCAALAFVPSVATGHSELVRSSPAAGSRLTRAPDAVLLRFSEPLRRAVRLRVRDREGRDRAASVGFDRRRPRRVRAALRPLTPGRYRVEWIVVAEDGFTQSGTFAFRLLRPSS
jgi:methionine-rich copper-binding protein CopC